MRRSSWTGLAVPVRGQSASASYARELGLAARALAVAAVLAGAVALAPTSALAAEAPCPSESAHSWCNRALTPDQRTALIMEAMSTAADEAVVENQAVPALGIPAAVANHTDGPVGAPAGVNSTKSGTGLPSASSLGATFSREMASLYGGVTGNDAIMYGYDGIWGPTLNTLRTPLAGRGEEYFGEDPFLISQMAINEVQGEQAAGAMSQIKHFVANDQEGQNGVPIISGNPGTGGRLFVNVIAAERTLHEIYLDPFEETIANADPASVMCSYNAETVSTEKPDVGAVGVHSCENPWLLKTVLRNELGFKGWVSPDFGADHNHLTNFTAGMDTGYNGNVNDVDAYLKAGQVTQAELTEHVAHILRSFFDHGVFDRAPYTDRHEHIDVSGQRETAMKIEEQGATLLTNREHVLPLGGGALHTIAVIGESANRYVRGSGSPEVAPFFHQTLRQGIEERAAAAGIKVVYSEGANLVEAAEVAKSADVAIVSAADSESEGIDKKCMSLDCPSEGLGDLQGHDSQVSAGPFNEIIEAVAAAQKHTVVVLQTGEPVLTPWREKIAGLIEAWYPGEAGGTAIAHILFGDVDPGGRLSSTFPASEEEGPATSATKEPFEYPGGPEANEYYDEGVMVGYRWYDENHLTPAFPFGYGLSYTTFAYGKLKIVPGTGSEPSATVSVTVKNTGTRSGWAVPELYVSLPSLPGVPEPPLQLKGFTKVLLKPGKSAVVTMPLNARAFSYYSEAEKGWRVDPGCDVIAVGSSSRDLPLRGVLKVAGGCKPETNTEFGCKSVKITFKGFPNLPNNMVKVKVTVDTTHVYEGVFTFNGSSAVDEIEVNVPPGHHRIDVFTIWTTNGVSGNHDQPLSGGITC
jgi:beta-glucosidase